MCLYIVDNVDTEKRIDNSPNYDRPISCVRQLLSLPVVTKHLKTQYLVTIVVIIKSFDFSVGNEIAV